MTPNSVPPTPEPEPELTLEEWIASCQSCCGIEPESWQTSPAVQDRADSSQAQTGEPSSS